MYITSVIIPVLVLLVGGQCQSLLDVDQKLGSPLLRSRARQLSASHNTAPRNQNHTFRARASSWSYLGCYYDNGASRTLTFSTAVSGLTPERCQAACQNAGYQYAGTEYSTECFCGNVIGNGAPKAIEPDCNFKCNGNNLQSCGGFYRLSIYQNVVTSGTPQSLGCFADNGGSRTLQGVSTRAPNLTPGSCFDFCGKQGFAYAGLEYGTECYCSRIAPELSRKASIGDCSTRCSGDSSTTCGGYYVLNAYQLPACDSKITSQCFAAATITSTSTVSSTASTAATTGPVPLGCFGDNGGSRTLQGVSTRAPNLTPGSCFDFCGKQGFAYAGLEYGTECYCSRTAPELSRKASIGDCSTRCSGDSSATCGGYYVLNAYQLPACDSKITSQCVAAATITSTSTVSSTASTAATTGPVPLGCFGDNGGSRTLQGVSTRAPNLTPGSCFDFCGKQGFAYAGLEYGTECYCSRTAPELSRKASIGDCSTRCSGDSSTTCGGYYVLNAYQLPACDSKITSQCVATATVTSAIPTVIATPTASLKALPSGTQVVGCFTDAGQFAAATQLNPLTPATCIQYCQSKGYNFAGTGAGFCSCSNVVSWSNKTPDLECANRCSGDVGFICGGTGRLSVYSVSSVIMSGAPQPASGGTKYLWSHFMVGNTQYHTQQMWEEDVRLAAGAGIDGFALNMGQDAWQVDRVATAFQTVAGSSFKLFLSFDMTAMFCQSQGDALYLANIVSRFAANPNQAYYKNKVLVTTFAGDQCRFGFGSALDGWNYFRSLLTAKNVPIYLMPSLFVDVYTSSWYDGHFDWDSAWPKTAANLDGSRDQGDISVLNSLGKGYMANISPAFFTYYGTSGQYAYNKNWIYQSDNWLLATRFELLMGMRGQLDMAEITSWNESHYIGPIRNEQPGSQGWVNGMPHTAWLTLIAYYAPAWKTGAYPVPTDQMIIWSRSHPKNGVPTNPTLSRPRDADWTADNLYALVTLSSPADISMISGDRTVTYKSLPAGLHKLSLASQQGVIGGQITRNGAAVKTYTSQGIFSFSSSFRDWNFNYFVQAL